MSSDDVNLDAFTEAYFTKTVDAIRASMHLSTYKIRQTARSLGIIRKPRVTGFKRAPTDETLYRQMRGQDELILKLIADHEKEKLNLSSIIDSLRAVVASQRLTIDSVTLSKKVTPRTRRATE